MGKIGKLREPGVCGKRRSMGMPKWEDKKTREMCGIEVPLMDCRRVEWRDCQSIKLGLNRPGRRGGDGEVFIVPVFYFQ